MNKKTPSVDAGPVGRLNLSNITKEEQMPGRADQRHRRARIVN